MNRLLRRFLVGCYGDMYLFSRLSAPFVEGEYAIYGTGALGKYLLSYYQDRIPQCFIATRPGCENLLDIPVLCPSEALLRFPMLKTVIIASFMYEQPMLEEAQKIFTERQITIVHAKQLLGCKVV